MSGWWVLVAFAAGWLTCWYFSRFIVRYALRRGDSLTVDVLSGLPQDKLLKVSSAVETELAKRRAQPSAEDGGQPVRGTGSFDS